MRTVIAAIITTCLLSSCAALSTQMRNPTTGETKDCSAVGWGILGVPVALAIHEGCKSDLRKQGFAKVQ